MFQLNTFHLWSKEKILLFTKPMRIKSRSSNYKKNKRSFSINPFAPHSSRTRKILFEFEFVHLESGLFYLLLFFFYFFFESIENLFFCMNRYSYIPIPSRYLLRKIPNWIQNGRVSVSLSMRLCTLQIGIHFLKDPGFRALVSRPRSFRWPMLCWNLYDPIDCVRAAVATEPGKVYRKDSSFLLCIIIFLLYSNY